MKKLLKPGTTKPVKIFFSSKEFFFLDPVEYRISICCYLYFTAILDLLLKVYELGLTVFILRLLAMPSGIIVIGRRYHINLAGGMFPIRSLILLVLNPMI